ncbi:Bug family tripartite tricarboxylate transporter substrate binding protein [Ovoidimarina sediminis]|uniref:Bug family tripartite tricarboxylate transporter substrate binding protein n=1 Tax=Ovoidimarina sediminis TaxID=3079856 RepID=UPI00290D809B|nr:tripartite tricarboxylate transporter substrate-binding protein [Rhodophyticola sp. MJ-SS7]MDU8941767.1 tripartite tricarboxylate transporter substrate-binding protein [Rhodophyticola sp. MJ-SS7]
MRLTTIIGAAVIAGASALSAQAQGYFEGKTVTYIIATNPGGGYDAYGRLIGQHLEEELGARRVVFKNLPGAGHIIGANTLYASDPDGLTIGTFNTGLIYAQILGREGIQFDLTEFEWIGKASADPRVMVLADTSGLSTFEDLAGSADPVRFASTGIGSASYTETRMLADALDLNIELIPGYQGNAAEMAMLRSEIAGQVGSLSSLAPFIDAGNAVIALGIGGDVTPQASEFATTDKARSIVSLIDALSSLGRLTAAPPGVAPEVVEELRDAYMSVMTDPDFLEEAAKLGLPIEAARGDAVQGLVEAAMKQSPETIDIIAAALEVEIPTVTVKSEILALADRNKEVTFMADGAETMGEISGSRTLVTLNGAEAGRGDLAVGMTCELTYDPAGTPPEFTAVACTGEATVAAAEVMTVKTDIIGLADGGKEVTFMTDGGEKMGEVSGSRTALSIDGAEAKRDALTVGMNCEFAYEDGAEIEFKTVACTTN